MAGNIEFLIKLGDELFDKRFSLLSFWQEVADNFYPERAEFTTLRSLGDDFAGGLMTSYPVLARRDLGNSFGSMLRPTSKEWFQIKTMDYEDLGLSSRQWLEHAQALQKRAMYDPRAMFTRATSEGDHDFAAFGQCAISVEMNLKEMALLYRCWHLRDMAWREDAVGQIGVVFRKWKPTADVLQSIFGDKVHRKVKEAIKDGKPFTEFDVWHCVVPVEIYDSKTEQFRTPFVSIYIDRTNNHEMECCGSWDVGYVIPRWQTVSGSQYAYSPATVTALPDARLIQAMTRVLLEAGEKAVDPPLIATQDMIRSDISVFAGGVTWVDAEYDEKMGEALRPMSQNSSGIPLGLEMSKDIREMITEAFFLNKLGLPPQEVAMTAFETGQRVQEYIRQALPLFAPMETNYNGGLCDMTFERLLRHGAFGSPLDMPEELRGQDIQFEFESPLREATERAKGQRFLEGKSMLAEAVALDPSVAYIPNVNIALRDVLDGIGFPAKWTNDESTVKERVAAEKQAQQAQQLLATMQQGADVAKTIGESGMIQ